MPCREWRRPAVSSPTRSMGSTSSCSPVDGRLHAFEDPGVAFERGDGDTSAFHADGATWDPTTGESTDGRRLERLPGTRLYAFAWQDAHGPDAFYG